MKCFLYFFCFVARCFRAASGTAGLFDCYIVKMKEGSNKVKLLGRISFSYSKIDPDFGVKYANNQLTLTKIRTSRSK